MTNIPTRLEEMEVDRVDATGIRPFKNGSSVPRSIGDVQGYDNFQCNPHPHLWRANLAPDEDEIFVDTIIPWTLDDPTRKWAASGIYSVKVDHNRTLRTPTDTCQEGIPDVGIKDDVDIIDDKDIIDNSYIIDDSDINDDKDDKDIRLKNADEWLTEYSSQINYDIGKKLHDILHKL